ncbi:MAG: hypothetical protein WDN69_14895 [Aliidongia sp.]
MPAGPRPPGPRSCRRSPHSICDVTLLIEEEARYYVESGAYRPGDLSILRFPDLPRGELRRLMCSKLVDDDTIRAINAALKRD